MTHIKSIDFTKGTYTVKNGEYIHGDGLTTIVKCPHGGFVVSDDASKKFSTAKKKTNQSVIRKYRKLERANKRNGRALKK